MHEDILSTIGNTPIVKLSRLFPDAPFSIFAKLETLNPGGSLKDRSALSMILSAVRRGTLRPGMTVIESSSGNMGIGLAQVCARMGLRFICVVDSRTTQQNMAILKAYGAEIELVDKPHPVTGDLLNARLERIQHLLRTIPDSLWTNQYANHDNVSAHYETMREIETQLDGRVDYLFCATSTCGTLRGCAEYVREHRLKTKIYAVDAVGSVIFGGTAAPRLLPGHGSARRPELFEPNLADHVALVTDAECVAACRHLLRREAILAGGSSGAVIAALAQVKDQLPQGATCALIISDRGERYLDTIYSDAWVLQHFGAIPAL